MTIKLILALVLMALALVGFVWCCCVVSKEDERHISQWLH